jgi:hypothetical protein
MTLFLTAATWVGCAPPQADVPPAAVKAIEAYGVTLDADAKPEQVVYVLLRTLA